MAREVILAASMLAADGGRLAHEARSIERAGADWLHLDVMDGHFVPNLSFGPSLVQSMARACKLFCDVHLMVQEPHQWLEPFCKAGANGLTIHAEAAPNLNACLQSIAGLGLKRGVSINPDSSIALIDAVLHEVDMVLVMSVRPGFGGQAFMPKVMNKVAALVRLRAARGLNFCIQVDGGIHLNTIKSAYDAGADVFVAGTALFAQKDYGTAVRALKQAAVA